MLKELEPDSATAGAEEDRKPKRRHLAPSQKEEDAVQAQCIPFSGTELTMASADGNCEDPKLPTQEEQDRLGIEGAPEAERPLQ